MIDDWLAHRTLPLPPSCHDIAAAARNPYIAHRIVVKPNVIVKGCGLLAYDAV
jgi:hypothetical protein